jgi:hypothetical protein
LKGTMDRDERKKWLTVEFQVGFRWKHWWSCDHITDITCMFSSFSGPLLECFMLVHWQTIWSSVLVSRKMFYIWPMLHEIVISLTAFSPVSQYQI